MKKRFFGYIPTILICMLAASSSLASIPPLRPGQTIEEAQEEARLWLEEYEKYSAEVDDYFASYDTDKQKIQVFGGNTEFFSNRLQLDPKTGDLSLVIEATGNKKVEVNLSYNMSDYTDKFFAANKSAKISISSIKIKGSTRPSSDLAPVVIERRGVAYLYAGEMYTKRIKIWEAKLWDELLQAAEKHPDTNFQLKYLLVLKVDETFYMTQATCEIPAKTIRAMKSVRTKLEKQAASTPPKAETYDRQLRVTDGVNEKGNRTTTLEPVEVGKERLRHESRGSEED